MGTISGQIDLSRFIQDKYNKTLKDLESEGMDQPNGFLYHIAVQKNKGMLLSGSL
jgi:hypothetical protein